MSKKARTLIMSFMVIALSFSIMAVGTYALFSQTASIKGHLIAGNMQMSLVRTALHGEETAIQKDFTNSTDNVFSAADGEDSLIIVPGGEYSATLKLSHDTASTVGYEYYVEIKLADASNADLASFLTVTLSSGSVTASGTPSSTGIAIAKNAPIKVPTGGESSFTVTVKFNDATTPDEQTKLNTVMKKNVSFDIQVVATQMQ